MYESIIPGSTSPTSDMLVPAVLSGSLFGVRRVCSPMAWVAGHSRPEQVCFECIAYGCSFGLVRVVVLLLSLAAELASTLVGSATVKVLPLNPGFVLRD